MNPILRILKNSTLLSGSLLLERSAGAFLAWYIARNNGAAFWGNYNTVWSFVLVASAIGSWGLNILLTREIGRNREKLGEYLGSAAVLAGISTIVTISAMLLVVTWIDYPAPLEQYIYLALFVFILPQVESFVFEAAIIGVERMEWVILTRPPLTLLQVGLSILLLRLGYGVSMLYIVLGSYHGLVLLAYWLILRHSWPEFRLRPSPAQIKLFFHLAIPFVLSVGITEGFGQIDRILLAKLRDADTVGIYSTGFLLIQFLLLLAPSVMNSLFPSLSRVYIDSRKQFTRLTQLLTKLMIVGLFPPTVLILSLAEPFIMTLFGSEYAGSVTIMRLTALAILPSYVSRIWYRATLASNNERMGILVAIVGGVAQLLLNLILIPHYGATGAALAMLGTVLIRSGHNLWNVTQIIGNQLWPLSLRLLISCAVSIGIFWALLPVTNAFLAGLICLVVFVPLLFVLRALRWEEMQVLLFMLRFRKLPDSL